MLLNMFAQHPMPLLSSKINNDSQYSVSSILITRLMLNLRDPGLSATVSQHPQMTALNFHNSQVVSTSADSGDHTEFMEVDRLDDGYTRHGRFVVLLPAD